MKKLILTLGIVLMSVMCFADGEIKEVVLNGNTVDHGEFVVYETEQLFPYMNDLYTVYNVAYEDASVNMKIGVSGKKYVAYNDDFIAFYECTKQGFGIRKIMFSNPTAMDIYNEREFNKQTILCNKRKIDPLNAMGLIAVYCPQLK